MTRMQIPIVECNSCKDRTVPVDTDSTVVIVRFPGQPERTYSGEHCATCEEKFLELIGPALEEFLAEETPRRRKSPTPRLRPDAPAAPPPEEPEEDRTCPICSTVRKTRGALRQHLKDDHNTNLKNLGLAKSTGRKAS